LALTGCFAPAIPDGALACGDDDPQCPPGLICADDGVCRSRNVDIDGTPALDAPVVDAAPLPDSLLGQWGAAVEITELTSDNVDTDPSLTDDQLEIYFASTRPGGLGGLDIWRATRADVDESWTNIEAVVELNTAGNDASPEVSGNGLKLFLTTGDNLYSSDRAAKGLAWSTPDIVTELNSAAADTGATRTSDELNVFFGSSRNIGISRIYMAQRALPGLAFDAPVLVPELSSLTIIDANPMVLADGLTIYYSRGPVAGDRDLYFSTRPSLTDPWGTPAEVIEINSTDNEQDPWVSTDQRTLVFSSNRNGARALYISTR
jgi:hypothetical protein